MKGNVRKGIEERRGKKRKGKIRRAEGGKTRRGEETNCKERKGKTVKQKMQVEEFRRGSSGSETISRPVEISEKLISIQTDTVGCGG